MRSVRLSLALVAGLLAAPVSASAETVLAIAPARSHATFAVQHLFVQRVTGSVPIASGSAAFAGGAAVPSRVQAILDPKHVHTDDADRDDDLQGPDWFDVARFPTWTFVSTAIAATVAGFTMQGTLTVHGVGQAVTLEVTTVHGLPHPAYHATGKVDRHGFGMRITPLDGTIGGQLDLTLDVAFQ